MMIKKISRSDAMHLTQDIRSKLIDGLLASAVMVLCSMVMALLIRPVEILFGRPGLLIYTVLLLAIGMAALERCINPKFDEAQRAAWGLAAGLVAWSAIELSNMLGAQALVSETGVLLLMLVGATVGILWRRVLPLGVRFTAVVLLSSWAGHLLIYGQIFMSGMDSSFNRIGQIAGFVVVGIAVLTLAWVFLESRTRLQRMSGAMVLWYCVIALIYIFRGGLY
jgi:hypothetical protein